jgi:chromosomal replication initiator protein
MNIEGTLTETELKNFWKKVMEEVEIKVKTKYIFNTLISQLQIDSIQDDVVVIACPSKMIADTIVTKYLDVFQDAINKIGRGEYVIDFVIKKDIRKNDKPEEPKEGPLFQQQNVQELIAGRRRVAGLSPKFTFDNYIQGSNNQLAVAIANAVADNPGVTYNPVFLYSGVGLGKTHLMQAIGNKIIENSSSLRVVYTTGESFTNELIESIKSGKGGKGMTPNSFRNKYRKADVLLIDDIQFIAGKSGTQEEFFHTFNALYMAQKQIVIASDRPPKDFDDIEERLTSRFNSGIISDIQAPDIETRVAILRYKRDMTQDEVSDDVINVIAQRVTSNIRELEGAYLRVLSKSMSSGVPPTKESAAQILGETVKEIEKKKPLNMNQILKAVCRYYSVSGKDLKGKRRTKELVLPRQVTMYLIKELTEIPLMTIGEFLGGRDHSTVIHGVDKIELLKAETPKVRQDITNVRQILDLE